MKVRILTSTGNNCGIAAYSRALVASLKDITDIEVESIREGKQSAEYYREQAERLNQADLVHIQHEHAFWGSFLPGKSAFWNLRYLIKKPVVITAHTTSSLAELLRLPQEKRVVHRIIKKALTLHKGYRDSVEIAPFITGRCIVHTEAGRNALIERGAIPGYVHLIPFGAPTALPAPEKGKAFRDKYGLSDQRLLTVFGFITSNKGYELALKALQELPPEFTLIIAGGSRIESEEPYRATLKEMIHAMKLDNRVIITGYLTEEEIAEAMAATEVSLVPHTIATGSYTVMQSLAYAKPIVTSDLPCFKEIQERESCMRLFRAGDADHFTACLKGVLKNPAGQNEMSERAHRYAEKYSWQEAAKKTLEVYNAALHDENS